MQSELVAGGLGERDYWQALFPRSEDDTLYSDAAAISKLIKLVSDVDLGGILFVEVRDDQFAIVLAFCFLCWL